MSSVSAAGNFLAESGPLCLLGGHDRDMVDQQPTATRRNVLVGAGALGVGIVVAACGGKESSESSSQASASASGQETTSAAPQGIKTSDIPVGGGTVFEDQMFVVTEPEAGQFKAFSAKCTHQGCTVGSVSNGTINCPCHGSKYSI